MENLIDRGGNESKSQFASERSARLTGVVMEGEMATKSREHVMELDEKEEVLK